MTDLCPIDTDLLPLCADHLLSEPSETFVRAHLAQCPDCAARLAALSQPAAELGVPPESLPLRRVHTALRRKRLYASLAALAVCAALLVSLFAFLTAPQIFPYSEDLLTLAALPEGGCAVVFSPEVTGYRLERLRDPESSGEMIQVYAYSTLWDCFFLPRGQQTLVLMQPDPFSLYDAPNPGGDDVALWGDAPAPGGTVTLPRLALNAYFLFALALLTLLILLRLALGRTAAASALTRVALLPLCYLAAQLAIKGSSFTTYTLQRDFSLIALLTLCLYLALLAVHALWRQRRKAN